MSENIKISTINIEVGKKKLELSVEEAKQLKSVLEQIFGKSTEVKIVEREIIKDTLFPRPYIWYSNGGSSTDYKGKHQSEITCDASKQLLSCRAGIE